MNNLPDNSSAPAPHEEPSRDGSWVAVGVITGSFGIHGELKVLPQTDFPERFTESVVLYVGPDHLPLTIAAARPQRSLMVLRLVGVETIEEAERLRGQTLWIPEQDIAPLPPDQFYLHDLIGIRVEDTASSYLGDVCDVITGAGNDLFVVRDRAGREMLLPAVKAFIKSVDLAQRIMRVEPIPGLFDEAGEEADDEASGAADQEASGAADQEAR